MVSRGSPAHSHIMASGGSTGPSHQHVPPPPTPPLSHYPTPCLMTACPTDIILASSSSTDHRHRVAFGDTAPSCIKTMDSNTDPNMVLSGSTGHSNKHRLHQQPRPLSIVHVMELYLASGSSNWTCAWPSVAAQTTEMHMNSGLQHGLGKCTRDTNQHGL